jgi:cytochrome c6
MKTSLKLVFVASIATALTSVSFAASAQEIWTAKCKMCHGADGNGTTTAIGKKPNSGILDYTSAEAQATFTDEQAVKVIKEGVKLDGKTRMPAYADKYTEEEINALVAHIRAMKK